MVKDLEWLVKLQKLDSKIYNATGEQRRSGAVQEELKIEIEEQTLFQYRVTLELEDEKTNKETVLNDIGDQKRILEQKKTDLLNDKKTKKEHIKREILKLEEAVIVFTERAEGIDERIKNLDEEILEFDKKIELLEKKLKTEVKRLKRLTKLNKKLLADFNTERELICENVRKPFLAHYNRILKIRHGMAITYVSDKGLCYGCKIHIPYQYQQKIKKMADYNICEGCGRVLVDCSAFKVEEPKLEIENEEEESIDLKK